MLGGKETAALPYLESARDSCLLADIGHLPRPMQWHPYMLSSDAESPANNHSNKPFDFFI